MLLPSLLHENESPNMAEVEQNLTGNLCRCTGFRPILDAMKSFAGDATQQGAEMCEDIEDLAGWVCPGKKSLPCPEAQHADVVIGDKGKTWISPNSLKTFFETLEEVPDTATYRLVAGNTGVGVYEEKSEIDYFIDVSKIPELKEMSTNPFRIGGGVSLADAMKKFESLE